MPFSFSYQDKLAAIEREIKYRERVYARMVASGRMRPQLARDQIEIMKAIAEDYRGSIELQDLFGKREDHLGHGRKH